MRSGESCLKVTCRPTGPSSRCIREEYPRNSSGPSPLPGAGSRYSAAAHTTPADRGPARRMRARTHHAPGNRLPRRRARGGVLRDRKQRGKGCGRQSAWCCSQYTEKRVILQFFAVFVWIACGLLPGGICRSALPPAGRIVEGGRESGPVLVLLQLLALFRTFSFLSTFPNVSHGHKHDGVRTGRGDIR